MSACGTTKTASEAEKTYETVASQKGCECVTKSGLNYSEVKDSCLAVGMAEGSSLKYGDPNVMPCGGITQMRDGIKLIMTKMQASCGQ